MHETAWGAVQSPNLLIFCAAGHLCMHVKRPADLLVIIYCLIRALKRNLPTHYVLAHHCVLDSVWLTGATSSSTQINHVIMSWDAAGWVLNGGCQSCPTETNAASSPLVLLWVPGMEVIAFTSTSVLFLMLHFYILMYLLNIKYKNKQRWRLFEVMRDTKCFLCNLMERWVTATYRSLF